MTDPAGLSIRRRITLLTDFGTTDGYAAAVRGVIASRVPDVLVDDVSHEIEPGDIAAAAWCLGRYWDRYPTGTIHVVVVDPGVGSARRGIAVEAMGRFGVGPDNGVLTPMLRERAARVVHLDRPALWATSVAPTFHGRDVFAPVAAHLAQRVALEDLGPPVSDAVVLAEATASATPGGFEGSVVHIDRFGNLITDIPGPGIPIGAEVRLGGRRVAVVRRIYADVGPGDPVALTGSSGWLEISVRDGSAARLFEAARGAKVEVVSS